MAAEIEALSKALARLPHVRWLGSSPGRRVLNQACGLGALAEKVDRLIPGGGIANTFMLAPA